MIGQRFVCFSYTIPYQEKLQCKHSDKDVIGSTFNAPKTHRDKHQLTLVNSLAVNISFFQQVFAAKLLCIEISGFSHHQTTKQSLTEECSAWPQAVCMKLSFYTMFTPTFALHKKQPQPPHSQLWGHSRGPNTEGSLPKKKKTLFSTWNNIPKPTQPHVFCSRVSLVLSHSQGAICSF